MAIPDFQSILLPLLKFAGDEKEHSVHEAIEGLTKVFNLSEEEKNKLLPSGNDIIFNNRVRFSRLYLKKAGLLEYSSRGYFKITSRGSDVLKQNPQFINIKFLEQFPEFIEFKTGVKRTKADKALSDTEAVEQQTPEEVLESGYQELRRDLAQELLDNVKRCPPSFFEKLVIELLLKMGYGGSRKDAGQAIGRSGDEGIDGIVKEDRLGLDVIYMQAKRWQGLVGRPEMQKFVGALSGKHAKKGIFITTSGFTQEALDYVKNIESKIILIDGNYLTQLMVDYEIGVSTTTSYEIKKIDSDYFTEE